MAEDYALKVFANAFLGLQENFVLKPSLGVANHSVVDEVVVLYKLVMSSTVAILRQKDIATVLVAGPERYANNPNAVPPQ
jgi:hypothetical protein